MIGLFVKRMASTSSIQAALKQVNESIQNAVSKRSQGRKDVRLVAVTKVKPVEDILAAYQCGQRHFGENYMNELEDKSKDQRIVDQCKEIKWHFIGHLQSNKAKKFVESPDINPIEMVWSALKKYLRALDPRTELSTKDDLENQIKAFWWLTMTPDVCNRYIDHIFKVVPVCYAIGGAATSHFPNFLFKEPSSGKSISYFVDLLQTDPAQEKLSRLLDRK